MAANWGVLRRLRLRLFGSALLGFRKLPGWRGSLPFYVFRYPFIGTWRIIHTDTIGGSPAPCVWLSGRRLSDRRSLKTDSPP